MKHTPALRRVAFASIAVAGLVGLTGCSQITSLFGGGATRDENGTVTEAGQNSVFDVKVGDCIQSQTGMVSDVPAVPCTEPHDEEIYYLFDLEGDTLPDSDTLNQLSYDGCNPAFTAYVGVDYETSLYDWYQLVPTEDTWASGDREVVCIAFAKDESQITGSIKGINK